MRPSPPHVLRRIPIDRAFNGTKWKCSEIKVMYSYLIAATVPALLFNGNKTETFTSNPIWINRLYIEQTILAKQMYIACILKSFPFRCIIFRNFCFFFRHLFTVPVNSNICQGLVHAPNITKYINFVFHTLKHRRPSAVVEYSFFRAFDTTSLPCHDRLFTLISTLSENNFSIFVMYHFSLFFLVLVYDGVFCVSLALWLQPIHSDCALGCWAV